VGSTLALVRSLRHAGAEAVAVYLEPWSDRFDPIVGDTPVVHEHHAWTEDAALRGCDGVVICDTGSWSQLADARAWIEPRREDALVIDHHAHGDAEVASRRLIDTSAAAACEIVARVSAGLLGVAGPRELPKDVAEAIYLGCATDTGWFRYSNTTSGTLRTAADLIEAGVDHNALYRQVEQSDKPARLLLVARALGSLAFYDEGSLAVMTITRRDLEETGATLDEVGGFTDLPQTVGTVRAVAVLVELDEGVTKVSLRSKAGEDSVDVNRVAKSMGGGGHVHAAGAKLHASPEEAARRVLAALRGEAS
jgi:phosphoesterase RecJ-like protein